MKQRVRPIRISLAVPSDNFPALGHQMDAEFLKHRHQDFNLDVKLKKRALTPKRRHALMSADSGYKIDMRLAWLSAVTIIGGCANYPLPDDVMGYSSRDIATQIRCDARYAIQRVLLEHNFVHQRQKLAYGDMTGLEAAAWFSQDPKHYESFDWALLSSDLAGVVGYKDTIVAIDFSLEGTETNDAGLSATVLGQFTKHTDTIGIDVGRTSTRQLRRKFRTFDSFDSLAVRMPEAVCHNFNRVDTYSKLPDKSYRGRPDLLFPSTGALRIETLIKDFIVQNNTGNLGGQQADWKTANMTDTITFTTKANGNLSPTAEIKPDGSGFDLTKIGFSSKNFRQDLHTIIVDLTLPVDKSKSPLFDNDGRLTLVAAKDPSINAASRNLDRAQDDNFRDDFRGLATIVARRSE